jgi:hypothetical protein
MVTGAVAGNISPEATSPFGNIFAEATRGGDSSADHPLPATLAMILCRIMDMASSYGCSAPSQNKITSIKIVVVSAEPNINSLAKDIATVIDFVNYLRVTSDRRRSTTASSSG